MNINRYIGMALFIGVLIISLVFFSYLFIIAAIIGLVLFVIGYIRARFFAKKIQGTTINQSTHHGRTINHDDL